MTVPRIYFPGGTEEGGLYKLGQENLRYVKTVLRMAEDERLPTFLRAASASDWIMIS